MPALLAAAGLAAYARSFTVPFQFDDLENLVQASRIRLTRLDWELVWPMLTSNRPLAQLTFGLSYWLWGLAPAGWHAVNLAVHVGAAIFAWLLGGELLARASFGDEARRARVSLIAALLFLLHPVQTQAVTYVVQRMASLAGCLALLATWLWFRGRRAERAAPWLAGAGASWVAAVLAKENAIALPAVVFGAEALFGQGLAPWLRRHRAAALAGGAAAAGLGAAHLWRFWPFIQAEQANFSFSLGERLLSQPRVIAHYLSLLAWPLPSRLRVDYSFPPSRGLLDPPSTLLALAALALLLGVAWWLRRRQPLATFAVLWFLGNLAVENTVLPVDLVFEHRLYLPSFGLLLAAAAGLERVLGARPARLWAVAAAGSLLLGAATFRRNLVWNDPAALRAQVLADAPGNLRALLALGNQSLTAGDLDGAERTYRAALAVQPQNPWAHSNLGSVARARGDLAQAERWYRQALAIADLEPAPLEGLGIVLSELGRQSEAEQQFQKLLGQDPRNPRALAALGLVRARQGDRPGSLSWLDLAVAADPADVYPQLVRGRVLLAFGQLAEALAAADRAAALSPRNPEAHQLRAECAEQLGRPEEAVAAWRKVLEVQPSSQLAAGNLRRLGAALP